MKIIKRILYKVLSLFKRAKGKIGRTIRKHPRLLRVARVIKRFIPKRLIRILKGKRKVKVKYNISKKQRKSESSVVFERNVKISVLVPLYNTPQKYLKQMIDSVINQTYSNWELCLADGSTDEFASVGAVCQEYAESDKRIKYVKLQKNLGISENTNACIDIATGDYIGLFDHDDLLHPSVLFEVAKAINEQNADFIYTDEVTFANDKTSDITVCNFKPDFSPDTLRSYNYICHFSVFSKQLLDSVGHFRSECDGSQDYDLILRLTEKAEKIVHIQKALYFWRSHKASTASDISAKPYIIDAAHKALEDHLERVGLDGSVEDGCVPSVYRIKYEIKGNPLVSIIIPNKDHIDDLDKCITSVLTKSTYRNFEIIVVENNSTEKETFEYYKTLEKYPNIKIMYWDKAFNYSAINNFAAQKAKGDYILLLNNDVEIITPEWLEEMLMFAQRDDVAAVGAKLYYPDDTVQHAGVILGIGGVAGHGHKGIARNAYGYMTRACIAQNLSACTAACLLIDANVYREVEGLDEGYAVAFNDVDLCMKIRQKGYLLVFTPYAELYHYESKSRGVEDTPEKQERFSREVKRFFSKWDKELKQGDPYYNPNLTLEFEDFSLK